MDRRLLLAALACWPALPLLAQDDTPRPRHKIPASQLYEALERRFPVSVGLQGLLQLEVRAPRLLLMPAANKLGATLQVQASGPALQAPVSGELDLIFALRYERADRSIRARDVDVLDLRLPGVPAQTVQTLKGLLPAVTRSVVGEVLLHEFSERELAVPNAMGVEPERLVVVDDGVIVVFGAGVRR